MNKFERYTNQILATMTESQKTEFYSKRALILRANPSLSYRTKGDLIEWKIACLVAG